RAIAGPPGKRLQPVPRRLFAYFAPVALFGLANSTDAFLLLKLTAEGAPAGLLPLAWLMLQAVKALVSFPAGWVADAIGSARVVGTGWALFAMSFLRAPPVPSLSSTPPS